VYTKGVSNWGQEQLSVIGDSESIRLITQDIETITDTSLDTETRLAAIASLAHHQVEVMSKQLQIGVDSMKSAERPSEEIMNLSKKLANIREIGWVSQYKDKEMYFEGKVFNITSQSALDQIAERVNQAYQQYSLEARPTHQFKSGFAEVEYSQEKDFGEESHEYQARTAIKEYNRRLAYAQRLKAQLDEAPGPSLKIEGELILVNPKGRKLTPSQPTDEAFTLLGETHDLKVQVEEQNLVVYGFAKGSVIKLGEISENNAFYQFLWEKAQQSNNGYPLDGIKLQGRPPLSINNLISYEGKHSLLDDYRALDGQKLQLAFFEDGKTGKIKVATSEPQEGKYRPFGELSSVGSGEFYIRRELSKLSQGDWYFPCQLGKRENLEFTVITRPGITEGAVDAAFAQLSTYKREVQASLESLPEEERMKLAAAAWDISHTKKNEAEHRYSKATAAFSLYFSEISSQFEQVRFTELAVGGVHTPQNQVGMVPEGEIVPVYIALEDNPYHPAFNRATLLVNGQPMGYLTEDSPQLPIDTYAQATITQPPLGAKALITLPDGDTFYVNQVGKFDYADDPLVEVSGEIEFATVVTRKNPEPAIKLNGRLLGTVTNTGQHRSRDKLIEKGYFSKGKQWLVQTLEPIQVTVERDSGFPVATVHVIPNSIDFPERFIMNKGIIEKENRPVMRPSLISAQSSVISDQSSVISAQSSVISVAEGKNPSSVYRIAVDFRQFKQLTEYLEANKIKYKELSTFDTAGREYNMGYRVLTIPQKNLSQEIEAKLISHYGSVLDSSKDGSYWAKLDEIEATEIVDIEESSIVEAGLADDLSLLNNNIRTPAHTQSSVISNETRMDVESSSNQPEDSSPTAQFTSQLTQDQQFALDRLLNWRQTSQSQRNLKDNFFLLTGYAGTGKTYLIQQFLQATSQNRSPSVTFTAPTNKATSVLKRMSQEEGLSVECITLHSRLGLQQTIDDVTGEQIYVPSKDGIPRFTEDIVVIDEVSMVNSQLYQYIQEAMSPYTKVVMMGDPAQLPPVGEEIAPIFADEELTNRGQLREFVRYGGAIGCLSLATNTEEMANPQEELPPIASSPDGAIKALNSRSFEKTVLEEFSSSQWAEDPDSFRVLAFTNAKVREWNQKIRSIRYGEDAPEFGSGELIVALNPCQNASDSRKNALNTSEESTILRADKYYDSDKQLLMWALEIEPLDSNERSATAQVIEVVAQESKGDFQRYLKGLKQTALKTRNKADWKSFYQAREAYASIDYGYAMTIHKSQGSTFTRVALDEDNINIAGSKQDEKFRNQLIYTALTRARTQVYVYNKQADLDAKRGRQTEAWYLPEELRTQKDRAIEVADSPVKESALNQQESQSPINISSRTQGLGGALTNPTELARRQGNISQSYPVSFRGNPATPAFNATGVNYPAKPAGVP
ncbi:MAG: ATP-dependent RecD-like DNA helicase, partial [Microcystaceae cyanobacterium]